MDRAELPVQSIAVPLIRFRGRDDATSNGPADKLRGPQDQPTGRPPGVYAPPASAWYGFPRLCPKPLHPEELEHPSNAARITSPTIGGCLSQPSTVGAVAH